MNDGGDPNLENICRNIDRLVTVEMRISDYARGVISKLYDAACAAQGGEPLSLLAARLILKNAKPGDVIFLTTGAGDPRFLPAGETDGPPGVAALALAIHAATGATPILLTEDEFVENLEATTLAAGLGLRSPEMARTTPWTTAVLPLTSGPDAERQAQFYLDAFCPTLLIAIEKIGPNPVGIAHTASGKPTADNRARAEFLFDIGRERDIPSIGVGDNGNEIGFGRILDAVRRYKPAGETLGTRVATDVLLPANTSNWGAYAIEAAMAAVLGRADIMHTPDIERRMLEACVRTNAVDGSTGRHIMAVDGMPAEIHYAIVTMLGGILRNGLIKGFKRPF
jgi:hypothetical protein